MAIWRASSRVRNRPIFSVPMEGGTCLDMWGQTSGDHLGAAIRVPLLVAGLALWMWIVQS
eukprot:scaffold171565_cov35-Attheya_sp.AAC.1